MQKKRVSLVSLREKGVDLNTTDDVCGLYGNVSLREKGVDLNSIAESEIKVMKGLPS